MKLKQPYYILLSTILFVCSTGCILISKYDETAYLQATSLKDYALTIMDKATEPYEMHKAEIAKFQEDINKAYEYSKSRAKNKKSTLQWEILKDPDKNLIGGFISRWKAEGTLGKPFIDNAKNGLISPAFDEIIDLESKKNK
ncbi:MAG: hypothetical protein ISR66_22540 [Desulfobacula sp.]|nr:hypothetical protein [Desulfobacula sp.]